MSRTEPNPDGCYYVVENCMVDYQLTYDVDIMIWVTETDCASLHRDADIRAEIKNEERLTTRFVCPEGFLDLRPIDHDYAILIGGEPVWGGQGAATMTVRRGGTVDGPLVDDLGSPAASLMMEYIGRRL